ncbi:NUDIX hydrolase [Bradyrhizobium sp. GCM10027634]|uniref:NUDIX hydrolase n=1 Tax=unclassified Bradyrhizobium TaxID=2631580 RepID=UPI00188A034C|nr:MULTISPECIES: NUDIX hydrolase [unclassified Bradyrhizobium]MDN4999410.1 NUDIX hydrolase [Bradyrhizobium sp. WYCCWR 12677]QOZ43653.1 NUDIX hydrolase [Bradyrhizobium sp. CCBAU 53340]
MTSPTIHRVTTLDLAVRPVVWPFAEERRAEIEAHFAEQQRARPKIFNGRVLLGRDPVFTDGHLAATYFETDFASFLAWRDWGFPDPDVFNGFGMGALRASDGAFVMGEMAHHTANSGRIYFPSGTPDLDDVRGGTLDIPGSVVREIEEETGLRPADYAAEADWHCVVTGHSIAMMQILNLDMPGDAARSRIEANLADQDEPELSAIHLVRSMNDLTPTMPRFVTAFVAQQFAAR